MKIEPNFLFKIVKFLQEMTKINKKCYMLYFVKIGFGNQDSIGRDPWMRNQDPLLGDPTFFKVHFLEMFTTKFSLKQSTIDPLFID
jgi:hypothetical protein